MRVVVTGGNGRIGRPTVRELCEHGHEVTVFELMPPAAPHPAGTRLILGTVDDAGAVMTVLRNARADAIVHLARATTNHDDLTVYRSNVLGTYHVLQAAATCGLAAAVVASSIQALGDYWTLRQAPHYLPLDEDHPCAPRGAYQIAKLVIEETCRAISREHGLTTVAIRPTAVIVPERWPELLRGRSARGAGGQPAQNPLAAYVDARDVGQLIRRAVERGCNHELHGAHVFHASGADPLFVDSLSKRIAEASPDIAPLAARLAPGQPGVSIARAQQLIGYEPRYHWRDVLETTGPQGT
ncbi:MAG: NAD(P)-dependent oxidoreductase [Chloroflexi bacterium]|nr:NAD(P)-dependent oxidoreductase [Chloroflexota bacterium]